MRQLLNTLFVLSEDAYLSVNGENVVISREQKEVARFPLHTLEGILCFSSAGASPALMGACVQRGVDIAFFSPRGQFLARTVGEERGNVLLRQTQNRVSDDPYQSCRYARGFILGKVYNARWSVERTRRDHALRVDGERFAAVSAELQGLLPQAAAETSLESLRGLEGAGATAYFRILDEMILQGKETFFFRQRSRRPPLDAFNALLSFAYSLLANDCASALESVGLDAYVGFLHRDRPGRESLALDLMEELRPCLADRFVLTIVNNRVLKASDFVFRESGAVLLTESLAAGVTEKEYDFNVKYEVEPLYSEWSYLVSGDAAPEGWNTLAGAPAWEKATPGNFPVATGVTQYYYKKFTASSLEDFSGVEISAISKAGLIVYLNGKEISRLNMPEYFDHTTHSTLEETVASTHIVGDIVLDGKLTEGENIVAFELHRYIKNEKVNSFDGSVILIMNNMYMVKDGVGTTVPAVSGSEGSDKAFDNNSDTKFHAETSCIGVSLTWTYNNQRREPINNYGLVSAGDCNTRHPSGWILEGSNDGQNWLQLHVAQNVMFTEYYQQKRFDFFNERAFNQYRVTTTACNNELIPPYQSCGSDHFQLADFYLFSKRVVPDCPRDGDFPPAMNGDLSYAACPDYFEGYRIRMCTDGKLGNETSACTPMKPQGIVFDSTEYNLFKG